MISLLTKTFMVVGGLYLLILLALYFGQRRLIYVPNPERVLPSAVGLSGIEEIVLEPAPGVKLLAWFGQANPGAPTILYFHGNGGNLAGRTDRINYFRNEGYGVFIMSYRSYSGSTGSPSELANISDALHAYDWLIKKGHRPDDIVIYGESLGTGVATQVAAKQKVAGLILDAPYTSLVDIAQYGYPYMPVRPFLKDKYLSNEYINRINAPLLILHGARDKVIPVRFGQSLFEVATQPKKIVVFPNGGHTDLYEYGAMREVRNFVQSLGK